MSKTIKMIKAKCQYCKKEVIGSEETFSQLWDKHLNECKKYRDFISKLEDMDKRGILSPYIEIIRIEAIEKDLKKIIKKWHLSNEELQKIVEDMEV